MLCAGLPAADRAVYGELPGGGYRVHGSGTWCSSMPEGVCQCQNWSMLLPVATIRLPVLASLPLSRLYTGDHDVVQSMSRTGCRLSTADCVCSADIFDCRAWQQLAWKSGFRLKLLVWRHLQSAWAPSWACHGRLCSSTCRISYLMLGLWGCDRQRAGCRLVNLCISVCTGSVSCTAADLLIQMG